MADDVVADLDEAIREGAGELAQRARDEIVALRRYKLENEEALEVIRRAAALIETTPKVSEAKRLIRNEALEEAAHECDEEAKASSEGFRDGCATCAAAIRALREKHDADPC